MLIQYISRPDIIFKKFRIIALAGLPEWIEHWRAD